MNDEEIEKAKAEIDAMTREDMARLWRMAPTGHRFFLDPLYDYFQARFKELGGWSARLSKKIGWE